MFFILFRNLIKSYTFAPKMYKSVFFWYFVSSIIRGTYSCEPKTKQEITARVTDSLQNYPEYESFTVFGDKCETYFRIESTDTDTNIEIQLKSPANNYFNPKLKRIKTFCSVSAVKKSVLSTSRETKLINKHKGLSETHSFDNLRNSLVSLTGYAKETVDTHCSESEKPLLIQTLMNQTLIQLVGTNPWRNTPHDYPYESVKLSNTKKYKYFTYNLWTDILALVVIGVVLIVFIPETTHLFIGTSPACVPCRLSSKLTQSIRFATMASIKYPTDVFTLANFKMAYENITSGFYSASGKFLHGFSKTEIKNQKFILKITEYFWTLARTPLFSRFPDIFYYFFFIYFFLLYCFLIFDGHLYFFYFFYIVLKVPPILSFLHLFFTLNLPPTNPSDSLIEDNRRQPNAC